MSNKKSWFLCKTYRNIKGDFLLGAGISSSDCIDYLEIYLFLNLIFVNLIIGFVIHKKSKGVEDE